MKSKEEVKLRLSEIRAGIRKIDRMRDPSTEAYEALDQLVGEQDALMWVLK